MLRPLPWLCLPTLLALSGCADALGQKDAHAPGDPVGLYQLTADADPASTCVEVIAAAPRPWTFEVTLRRDGHTAFWIANDEPISGTVDDKGTLAFRSTSRVQIRPADKVKELAPCVVLRTDDFTGSLAGAPATADGVKTFSGTLRYVYAVEQGADCSDIVGARGAGRPTPIFSTLPCEARFSVNAKRTGDPGPVR